MQKLNYLNHDLNIDTKIYLFEVWLKKQGTTSRKVISCLPHKKTDNILLPVFDYWNIRLSLSIKFFSEASGLGLKFSEAANFSRVFFSSLSKFLGTHTFT